MRRFEYQIAFKGRCQSDQFHKRRSEQGGIARALKAGPFKNSPLGRNREPFELGRRHERLGTRKPKTMQVLLHLEAGHQPCSSWTKLENYGSAVIQDYTPD
jgi:hypothetical protein